MALGAKKVRSAQLMGIASLFADKEFSKAWEVNE
jgi:hypothetical protein